MNSMPDAQLDYAMSGLTIQEAMLDLVKRFPDKKRRPDHILWGGRPIKTADSIPVPARGTVRAEFLTPGASPPTEGFDMKLNGHFTLAAGERVSTLRTWNDDRYEPVVEYPFESRDGALWVWNVYSVVLPGGTVREEKWTGNAGFWVESPLENQRIYHCSPGTVEKPNFESLVFKLTIEEPGN